jgi:hypothetical protein
LPSLRRQLAKSAPAIAAVSGVLLAAGCSHLFNRDHDTLDKFSRAYTDFLNIGEEAESLWQFIGPENDPSGFWMTFKGALATDPSSSDSGRFVEAEAAIVLYEKWMPKVLEGEADEVEKLDNAVQRLFETANAIHNREYREDAVQVAKYAREAEASFASGNDLTDRRTRLQRRMLDDIVRAGGSLGMALRNQSLRVELGETTKISKEIENVARKSTTAMQNLKDTFSALKGKTNLKAYAIQGESQDKTDGKGQR